MTRLQELHERYGQSPWLDNLSRTILNDGTLARSIETGIRGVTANPAIFAKAIEGTDAYDDDFERSQSSGMSASEAYWELVLADVRTALTMFDDLFERSAHRDGFVSIEVDPALAGDTDATINAARWLHQRIDRANALVKIPATDAGLPAIEAMTAEGRSINITLIFSLPRYRQVIDAYQNGLETLAANGGDPSKVHSVASFFVSRVDTEVDRRLAIIEPDAGDLRRTAAIAQARLAYQMFLDSLTTERWHRLAAAGANIQRPLWASTSAKNPEVPDTIYIDRLIGPDTVTTIPENTITAFEHHGTLERTVDRDPDDAHRAIDRLTAAGIDLDDVAKTLEEQGIDAFIKAFTSVLRALETKSDRLATR